MEMTMTEYDTLIGWKFMDAVDIHQMIEESENWRNRWYSRILCPSHGKQNYYQNMYYMLDDSINPSKYILYKESYPRREYMVVKAAGRYWKLTNEITKAKMDQINSFLDKISQDGIKNAYFDMKTWKQIPVDTPFWVIRKEGKAEFSLTAPVMREASDKDELPWF